MKKNIFLLTLLLTLAFSTISVSAKSKLPEELGGNNGYDGMVTVYMYVAPGANTATNVVRFMDVNTGAEFYALFNPMNYKHDDLWYQVLNIPQGEYLISGGRYLDTKAEFFLETDPTIVTLGKGMPKIVVTVAPRDWFKDNKIATMEDVDRIRKEQVAKENGTIVEDSSTSPTVPPISTKDDDEYYEDEESYEDEYYEEYEEDIVIPTVEEENGTSKKKLGKIPLFGAVVVILFVIVFCIPKKKHITTEKDE